MSPFQKSMQLCLQNAVFSLWEESNAHTLCAPSRHSQPCPCTLSLAAASGLPPASPPQRTVLITNAIASLFLTFPPDTRACPSLVTPWFTWAPLPLLSQWDSHFSRACRPARLRHSSCYSLSIFLFAKKISHSISCHLGILFIPVGLTESPVE